MTLKEFYQAIGGDYSDVASRLQSDAVIGKFVKKFALDTSVSDLKAASESNNIKASFLAAHTLKGLAGTLGMKVLADAATKLTEQLRPLKSLPDSSYFFAVYSSYEKIIGLIPQIEL